MELDTILETAGAAPAPVPQPDPAPDATDPLLDDELLVEEISIDGMCGVY